MTTYFLAFLMTLTVYSNSSLTEARRMFHANMEAEQGLIEFIEHYEKTELAEVKAYIGLATTMRASHTIYPARKLRYFNEGKAIIENVITQNNQSAEMRYTRLLVQLNVPSFLNYSSNIEEDLDLFMTGISQADISLYWKKKMVANLIATDGLNSKQQEKLNTINLNR